MDTKLFKNWLDDLEDIWKSKNIERIIEICAENFTWYETPFVEPITTKEVLLKEWESVNDHKDLNLSYEIIIVNEKFGIAHWHATFTRIRSNESVKMDGIYQVFLNEDGKCTEFHQWYNSK